MKRPKLRRTAAPSTPAPSTGARARAANLRVGATVQREAEVELPSSEPVAAESANSSFRVLDIEARRAEKRAEKRKHRRRIWVRRVLIMLVAAALIGVLIWLFFFSAVFRVSMDRVTVSGAEGTSIIQEIDVNKVLEAHAGELLITLPKQEIVAELEQIPEVEQAQVNIKFPRSLAVQLTAQQPYVCWGEPENCVVLARDGAALRVPAATRGGLPTLTVADSSLKTAQFMAPITAVRDSLDTAVTAQISGYSLSESGQVGFTLRNGGTVNWGTASDGEMKLQVLKVLLTEKHSLYDVSIPTSPVTQ